MARNEIIERLKSKDTSIYDFNFDNLQAPPISSIFSTYDLERLHYLATSIKMSGKQIEKLKEINDIMESKGFTQFINGTNRVVYEYKYDDRFLCKVAYNSTSCNDSLSEFYNQYYLKPFVTKIFEVTPDGVLSFAEKVIPITNTDMYLNIAKEIYLLLNEWVLGGGFVFDDLGTEDFMNIGIRAGFGPVLLDFPYMYPLDRNKIFCKKEDKSSPTGCCEGEIDYDPGFNDLRCTKCGAPYRAKELAKDLKEHQLINTSQGGYKLSFKVSGGKLGDKVIEHKYNASGVKSIN